MHKDKVLKLAKGFRGRAKNCIRIARERVEKSLQYAFRDRKTKKREMRSLWITRISAGSRQYGVRIDLLTCFVLFSLPNHSLVIASIIHAGQILGIDSRTTAG